MIGGLVLEATFPKLARPGAVATLVWSDGLEAEMPIRQHPKHHRMPHDLEHYVVDAGFDNVYAFWPLLARQAAFTSVRPRNRPWGRERIVLSRELFASHADEMDASEAMVAPIRTLAHGDFDWAIAQEVMARSATARLPSRLLAHPRARVERVVDEFRSMEERWQRLPDGNALTVRWPPHH